LFSRLTFKLVGVDITHLLDKDNFPEYFEESMKGDGYFDYEVQPLVFAINTLGSSVVPARGQWVEIIDNRTGLFLLQGKIDEIVDDESNQPEITVFPQALLLKDTTIGDEVVLSDDETVIDFEFPVRHIRDTVNDILARVNASHGTSMMATHESVPDQTNTGKFFGNVLQKYGEWNFGKAILNFFAGGSDGQYFSSNDSDYFLILSEGTTYQKTLIKEGQWMDNRLGTIPSSAITVPWFKIINRVYLLSGGGMDYQGTFSNGELGQFGTQFKDSLATNVPSNQFTAFAKEEGLKFSVTILSSFDSNDRNSYALVEGRLNQHFLSNPDEYSLRKWVLSFETTFEDEYGGHYRDASASEVLRDLSVVANRWLYVDRSGLVYLLLREQTRGTINLSAENTLSETKTVKKEKDVEVNIQRYIEDEEGKVTNYGLSLRGNEVDSIKAHYREIFSGEVIQRDLEMFRNDDDTILKTVVWDYKPELENVGIAISSKKAFLEPRTIIRVEK